MQSSFNRYAISGPSFFSFLTQSEMEMMCEIQTLKPIKGSANRFEPIPTGKIFVIDSGVIKLFTRSFEPQPICMDILYKKDSYGDFCFIEGLPLAEFYEVASSEAVVFSIAKLDLALLLERRAGLAKQYMKCLSYNYQRLVFYYRNMQQRSAKVRLLFFFYLLIERLGICESPFIMPNYLSQAEIGEIICCSRKSVQASLSEFEEDRLLIYSHKEIVLLDCNQIRFLAGLYAFGNDRVFESGLHNTL